MNEPKNTVAKRILSSWLDDKLNSLDPGTDEIAIIIFNDLLEEHSCCDVQTWHIKDPDLYREILDAWPSGNEAEDE